MSALVTVNEHPTLALRAPTSAELYLNATYYSSQPLFINLLGTEKNPSCLNIFFSVEDTFEATVLLQAKPSSYVDWVKQDALKIARFKVVFFLVNDGSIKCFGIANKVLLWQNWV